MHENAVGLTEDRRGFRDVAQHGVQQHDITHEVEPPLISTGKTEQAVDEVRHARHFVQPLLQELHLFVGAAPRHHRPLDAGPQHGERCLELVTRVGGEPSQSAEAVLQAADHRIQRAGEAREFITLRIGTTEPAMQRSSIGDGFQFADDRRDRTHRHTTDHIRRGAADQQHHGGQHEHGAQQVTPQLLGGAGGAAGDDALDGRRRISLDARRKKDLVRAQRQQRGGWSGLDVG